MIVLAQYLQHQGEQFLVVLHHQDLARILSDEDALADRCQLRFVFRSRLEFQLRFLACLSDGFPIYCICFSELSISSGAYALFLIDRVMVKVVPSPS